MEKVFSNITKYSIYLLVFLLPLFWLPFSFEVFEFNKQFLLFFLATLAFFSWIAKMVLVDKEIRFKRTPLDIPVLAFLFVAILSAIFSVDKISSLFGFYGRFSDGLIGLLSLGLLYFLITNNVSVKDKEKSEIKSSKLVKLFLWAVFFVILCSYLSILGVGGQVQNLLGDKLQLPLIMLQRTFNQAAGSMEGLSVFLAVVLVFLVGKIIGSTGEEKRGAKAIKYFLLFSTLVLLAIIDFTAAWLVILISLVLFLGIVLWQRIFKEDVNKLLLPVLLIILSGAFLLIDTSNFQSTILNYSLPQEQVLGQVDSWNIGFKSATEEVKSGVLGSGIGTFHYEFSKFKPIEFNQTFLWQIRFDRAGSHMAETLGTMGFLGILSYLVLAGMFLLISYFFLKGNKSGVPLLMAFLALLVSQFVFYQNTVLAFLFWLILGLSVINWQKPVKEKVISFKDFPELSLVFSAVIIVLGLGVLAMYFFAGKFYLADVNYDKALGAERTQRLEKAVSLNPYQPQYKIVLSRNYLSKALAGDQEMNEAMISAYVHQAITYVKGGDIGRNTIKGAVELSPNRVAAQETLGMIYRDIQGIAQGALEWGIKSFEKAIELEPTNPVLYTELGKLYLISGDMEMAKVKFIKAREVKPDYIDASIQLVLIYESENNLPEAIRQMENLASSYPYNIEVLFQLGRLYFNSNQTNQAISYFERIIELMPNHSNAHYSLGVAYQDKGQITKAIAEFEKVLELNPGNQDVQGKLQELKRPAPVEEEE